MLRWQRCSWCNLSAGTDECEAGNDCCSFLLYCIAVFSCFDFCDYCKMFTNFSSDFASEWWRRANEGYPVPVTETKLKSRLRQLNLREGLLFFVLFSAFNNCWLDDRKGMRLIKKPPGAFWGDVETQMVNKEWFNRKWKMKLMIVVSKAVVDSGFATNLCITIN